MFILNLWCLMTSFDDFLVKRKPHIKPKTKMLTSQLLPVRMFIKRLLSILTARQLDILQRLWYFQYCILSHWQQDIILLSAAPALNSRIVEHKNKKKKYIQKWIILLLCYAYTAFRKAKMKITLWPGKFMNLCSVMHKGS